MEDQDWFCYLFSGQDALGQFSSSVYIYHFITNRLDQIISQNSSTSNIPFFMTQATSFWKN